MRDEIDSPHPQNGEGESSGEQSNQFPSAGRGRTNADTGNGPEEGLHLKGDMQGIAGKLNDPASRLAVTGESFRPLLFCQDGPEAFAGCRSGRFAAQEASLRAP